MHALKLVAMLAIVLAGGGLAHATSWPPDAETLFIQLESADVVVVGRIQSEPGGLTSVRADRVLQGTVGRELVIDVEETTSLGGLDPDRRYLIVLDEGTRGTLRLPLGALSVLDPAEPLYELIRASRAYLSIRGDSERRRSYLIQAFQSPRPFLQRSALAALIDQRAMDPSTLAQLVGSMQAGHAVHPELKGLVARWIGALELSEHVPFLRGCVLDAREAASVRAAALLALDDIDRQSAVQVRSELGAGPPAALARMIRSLGL